MPLEDQEHHCSKRPKAVQSMTDTVREHRSGGYNILLQGQTAHASWSKFLRIKTIRLIDLANMVGATFIRTCLCVISVYFQTLHEWHISVLHKKAHSLLSN